MGLSDSKGIFNMSLVSVSIARSRLGVSAQSVRRFIDSGELVAEKSDTNRWMVDEGSLDALIASRKAQHPKGLTATPKATNVAKNSNINAVKLASQSNIATAKSTQARDISRFRDVVKPVLDDQGVTWLTAQELILLFHNNLFEFSNAEKFTVEVSTDWSEYLEQVHILSSEVGSLVRFDPDSASLLCSHEEEFYRDQVPNDVWRKAKGQLTGCFIEIDFHRFISINYGGVVVCRSASEPVRGFLLAESAADQREADDDSMLMLEQEESSAENQRHLRDLLEIQELKHRLELQKLRYSLSR